MEHIMKLQEYLDRSGNYISYEKYSRLKNWLLTYKEWCECLGDNS